MIISRSSSRFQLSLTNTFFSDNKTIKENSISVIYQLKRDMKYTYLKREHKTFTSCCNLFYLKKIIFIHDLYRYKIFDRYDYLNFDTVSLQEMRFRLVVFFISLKNLSSAATITTFT
jgi:hypothetical protein